MVPSTFAEDLPHADHSPASYVRETARQKTLEVARRLQAQRSAAPAALIIGADTVGFLVQYLRGLLGGHGSFSVIHVMLHGHHPFRWSESQAALVTNLDPAKQWAAFIAQVVEVDGDILEKPADEDDAIRMLTRCSFVSSGGLANGVLHMHLVCWHFCSAC